MGGRRLGEEVTHPLPVRDRDWVLVVERVRVGETEAVGLVLPVRDLVPSLAEGEKEAESDTMERVGVKEGLPLAELLWLKLPVTLVDPEGELVTLEEGLGRGVRDTEGEGVRVRGAV